MVQAMASALPPTPPHAPLCRSTLSGPKGYPDSHMISRKCCTLASTSQTLSARPILTVQSDFLLSLSPSRNCLSYLLFISNALWPALWSKGPQGRKTSQKAMLYLLLIFISLAKVYSFFPPPSPCHGPETHSPNDALTLCLPGK